MAVSAKFYGKFFLSLANKQVDLDSDSIKCMLVQSGYTPDQDAHQYKDVSITNEASGTGYTAGGAAIASPVFTYTGATNTFAFDGADVAWASNTATSRYAVVYDDSPASNKPLIAYVDFGEDKVVTALTWDPAGIATVTVA
jgi:hypothetical protein